MSYYMYMIKVGRYTEQFNNILGIRAEEKDIFMSSGLVTHMIKRNHQNCLKYVDCISDIIEKPDFIGVNPNEKEKFSMELIKCYADNVLVGVKLDQEGDYLYVATMHEVSESKIKRRLHSGRIRKCGN